MPPEPHTLAALRDVDDPAWPVLESWIARAHNAVEVLGVEPADGEATLVALQVSAHATLGAVALRSGGLRVDGGWLRILGGAPTGLRAWNGLGVPCLASPRLGGALLVAHDAVGGFFAVNGGAFEGPTGNVFYFAPDTLEWEDLERGYTAWLQWALDGDLQTFYENARWDGWEEEVAALDASRAILLTPPLWAEVEEGAGRTRRAVPTAELWAAQLELRAQLAAAPSGSKGDA